MSKMLKAKPSQPKEKVITWIDVKGSVFRFSCTSDMSREHSSLMRNNPYVRSFTVQNAYKEEAALL